MMHGQTQIKTGSELQRNIEARSCNHCCRGKSNMAFPWQQWWQERVSVLCLPVLYFCSERHCITYSMPPNGQPNILKNYRPKGRRNQRTDNWRDFWMCDSGTGQHLVQLYGS